MDANKVNVVVGPPGTGKTTTLIGMPPGKEGPVGIIEQALADGVRPNKIGFISFTRKAAEEGRQRAAEKFNMQPDDLLHFRTLHSMAMKYTGIRRDQIVGWTHYRELGRMLGIDLKGRTEVAEDDVYGMAEADRMLFLEGLARNTKRPLKEVWNDAFEDSIDWWELERFAKSLSLFKKDRMLFDFTDMLEKFCLFSAKTMPQFDLLIVDEAQDLNPLQWDMVELLSTNSKVVYVAGDDDQAIYKWSGADVDKFISLPGSVRVLDVSYRIPSAVHLLAESISNRISKRRPKHWAPRTEVGSVNWFSSIEEVDLSKGTWLLLARNGYLLNELEDWCLSQGFSFNSVNRDPLKSDALTAIRVWENLRRGQEESAEHILDMLKYMNVRMIPAALIKKLKADEAERMYAIPELKTLGLGTTSIWHESLTRISPKERDFFLAARRRGEPLLKEPRIKISTIHASKGGQADHVLLLTDLSFRCYSNMEQNMDDEVRVWYVAATRCKESLNLVMPKTNLNFEF